MRNYRSLKKYKYPRHRVKFSYTHIILLWYKILDLFPSLCPPLSFLNSRKHLEILVLILAQIQNDINIFGLFIIQLGSFCLKIISPFWSKMTHCASYFFPHPLYWPLFLFTRLKCHFSSCSNSSALHFHNFLLYYILFEEIQHFSSIHVVCCQIFREHIYMQLFLLIMITKRSKNTF